MYSDRQRVCERERKTRIRREKTYLRRAKNCTASSTRAQCLGFVRWGPTAVLATPMKILLFYYSSIVVVNDATNVLFIRSLLSLLSSALFFVQIIITFWNLPCIQHRKISNTKQYVVNYWEFYQFKNCRWQRKVTTQFVRFILLWIFLATFSVTKAFYYSHQVIRVLQWKLCVNVVNMCRRTKNCNHWVFSGTKYKTRTIRHDKKLLAQHA